jgi:putative hydrolase of the HAD superfamily
MNPVAATPLAERFTGRGWPPAGIRAVVFDVVGTLVEPAPRVADAYAAAGQRQGVVVAPVEIDRRFRAAWRRQELLDAAATPPFATSGPREVARWRAIVGDVFADHPACDAIFADLWEHFGRPQAWRPVPAGVALARGVVEAGIDLVLASNFDERLFAIAAVVEPLTWARHVFASSEVGWRKPAGEFFRTVERRLGLTSRELVLVGDDPELDLAAGRRAGWHVRDVAAPASTAG